MVPLHHLRALPTLPPMTIPDVDTFLDPSIPMDATTITSLPTSYKESFPTIIGSFHLAFLMKAL
jgi:hypothetical protein